MRQGRLKGDFYERLELVYPQGEPVILGSWINCTGSASLTATFVVILIGFALAGHFERRKIALSRSQSGRRSDEQGSAPCA